MSVIEQQYLPSRQRTEEAELDAWLGVAPLPRLQMAPPEGAEPQAPVPAEQKSDISLTMTPKGVVQPPPSPYGTEFPNIMADTLAGIASQAAPAMAEWGRAQLDKLAQDAGIREPGLTEGLWKWASDKPQPTALKGIDWVFKIGNIVPSLARAGSFPKDPQMGRAIAEWANSLPGPVRAMLPEVLQKPEAAQGAYDTIGTIAEIGASMITGSDLLDYIPGLITKLGGKAGKALAFINNERGAIRLPGGATDLTQKAIQKFGTTTNPQDALFLLDDGTLLSKANGPRTMNHDDISSVMTTTKKTAAERIAEFSQQTGAARITDEGEGTLSLQAFGPLTEAQITRILRAGSDHRLIVVDSPGGSGRFDMPGQRSELRAFLTGIEGPGTGTTEALRRASMSKAEFSEAYRYHAVPLSKAETVRREGIAEQSYFAKTARDAMPFAEGKGGRGEVAIFAVPTKELQPMAAEATDVFGDEFIKAGLYTRSRARHTPAFEVPSEWADDPYGAMQRSTREAAAQTPGKFNAGRQQATEEVTNLTAAINVRAREMGMMAEQTRGKQAWTETDIKANALVTSGKMNLDRILALRPGDVLNAEEGMAARNIRDAAATQFKELMAAADAGDEVAKAALEQVSVLASRIETNIEAATGTEIARALAIRRHASSAYEADDIYQRLMRRTIDPEVLYQFYKHLTDHTQREAFTKYLETTSRTGRWVNAFLEARAAGLLTIRSIERNVVGSAGATIWSVPERAATAAFGTLRGTDEGAYAHEALSMIHGIYQSQVEALRMAGKSLKTGESQFLEGASQVERAFLPAISGDALNIHGPMGRFVDVMGEIIRWPFRGLVAGDDYFKYVNYSAEKYALAYREYRKLLNEGTTKAEAAAEYGAIIKQPPEWLHKAASEHALYTTFNDEVINPAGKAILAVRDNDGPAGQIGRFILPFARTPMNVMGYGAERTPGLNFLSSHYWQEIQAGGIRKDAAYARLALGSGVFALFSVLAANGVINGRGPKDPKLRKMMEANGWTPYSINIPGRNPIPVRGFSPLSEIIMQAGDFGEMVNQGADEMTLGRLAGAMVLSQAHVMEDYPMLKGLADIHEAISEGSGRSEGLIQETLKSMVPLPGLQGTARTIAGITDPHQRETRSPQGGPRLPGTLGILDREVSALWEEMAASTPWLQNYQHPKRDILGRPMLRQGGWWAPAAPSAQGPHPVMAELIKHSIAVGLPAKAFGPGKQSIGVMDDESMDTNAVALSPDEWARFQALAGEVTLAGGFPSPNGRTLEQELTRLMASPEYQKEADGPVGGKASLIQMTFREYRDAAKEKLFKELRENGQPGDLERLVQEKELLQDFKSLTKAQQAAQRPALEKKLGRSINIGILK